MVSERAKKPIMASTDEKLAPGVDVSARDTAGGAIDCPLCGRTTKVGLPQDATIESITSIWDDSWEKNSGKTRTIECVNRHPIQVCFSYQRDIDPLIRELQTCTKIPWAE